MEEAAYFTYIIESINTGGWYYGHTDNMLRRMSEHNSGQTNSTRNRGPWKLIFKKGFTSKAEAYRFELELKKLKNKDYIRRVYRRYFNGV